MRSLGLAALRSWTRRQSLYRGLMGTSRVWMLLFVTDRSVRALRFLLRGRKPVTVFSERLGAGDGFEIRRLRRHGG